MLRIVHVPAGPAEDAYRGPDRRSRPAARHGVTLAWAAAVLASPAVAAWTAPRRPDHVAIAASATLTLALLVGLLACCTRRAVGEQRLFALGVGLVALGCGPVFVAAFVPADVLPGSPYLANALVAALPPLALLVAAPFGPPVDTRPRRWVRIVPLASVGVVAAVGGALVAGPMRAVDAVGVDEVRWPARPWLGVLAAVCAAVAAVYAWRGRREHSELIAAFALVPLAGAVAAGIGAARGDGAAYPAWAALCTGLAGALFATVRGLLRAHRNERRRVLAALVRVETLEAASERALVSRGQVHDLRSGLLVLEGAVARLADDPSDRDLARAVAAEVVRLRALLDRDRVAPGATGAPATDGADGPDASYALGEAIAPVLTCARAAGLTVRAVVDDDLVLPGDPTVAAQVVHGLLANAVRHAPGSPVEVACSRDGDDVVVRVADHGPGLAAGVRGHLFEPGVRNAAAGGDGIGLAASLHLARSQQGDLRVVERADGVTFELRLPAGKVPVA